GKVSHFSVYGVLLQAPVATITINRDTTIQVQKTLQFTATLKDIEQLTLNRVVTWTSSNPAAVTIDANGLARTHVPGQSTIAAASEGKTASATVTVVPGPPTALAIVAGDGQTAVAGSAVATPPAVKVTDAFGNPISGFAITFAVASGGGTITGGAATTNASGIATIGNWTLGTTAGPNTLTASGSGLTPASVTFTATGGAGIPTTVAAFAGNNQTGTAGGPVAAPPSVKVTDVNGNPVAGFNVIFSPGSGNGAVTGGSAVTNSSGIAAPTSWVLGSIPGVQTLVATAGSLSGSPITFSATAVAPIPAKIVSNSLDPQTGTVRKAVGAPPTVRVLDAADIPVPGYTVTFAVSSGGGSVTGGTVVTNEGGYATVGSWILGASPGTNTLSATAGTLQGSPIIFTATGVQPPPATMAISAGQNQSALAGTQVSTRPAVIVTDASGDGVPGITIVFSIRSGSGSISGASAETNGSGIATLGSWTLGIGGNSLFASVDGLPGSPLIFHALGTAQVQVVTFGDSNTDYGYSGRDFPIVAASYVSNFPSKKLGPNEPNSSFQLAGKIESRWRASQSKTIVVVNHGVGGTTTGTGRTILFSPNAREVVNGVTRFEGEALGVAYPWSGGEAPSVYYPSGPIARVQAFTPRPSDFLYISMGTNDLGAGISTASTVVNLEWMVDLWIARGVPANHIIVTTLPPRQPGQSASLPALNAAIRAKFQAKGVNVIDIAAMTSDDGGATWKSASLHVGDSVHYAEVVRNLIADAVVNILLALTPP
ncbi:MAG TPA: GDSL-type esterase/lipase family protein, partial [Gemmatimonadaceae bacterium]|nr:GDSL-type esterase/lipase family protein [Gemmatimonadaceae bacterium]